MRGYFCLAVLFAVLFGASTFAQTDVMREATPSDAGRAVSILPSEIITRRTVREFERTNLGWIILLGLPGLASPTPHQAQLKQCGGATLLNSG